MPVSIHGKQYKTVAERINEFREAHKYDVSIETDLVADNDGVVIMKATVKDNAGRTIGTGYAEEVRGSTNINKTSALENCETSAIGRALANIGFGGTEYASANEVTNAIIQQQVLDATEKLVAHNKAVVRNIDSVYQIKAHIANDELAEAFSIWSNDIDDEDKAWLWLAPTRGGIFTTEERESLKKSKGVK